MKKLLILSSLIFFSMISFSQQDVKIKKKDRRKDVELVTNYGNIVLRLNDSTPLHRDNFIRLVKTGYYDSVLFIA